MSSEVIGQMYDPRGGLQERNGRSVEYIEWKKHDPDEEIDVNDFPHREILGPGYERFHPQMLNLGTLKKGNKAHHDGVDDSAKTKESFFRSPWPATYYLCTEWITMPDNERVRCLYAYKTYSTGCHDHLFVNGGNQALKDAKHKRPITWRQFMDPIELLKSDYEVKKAAREELFYETLFSKLDYQTAMKTMEEREAEHRKLLDQEIQRIMDETRVRTEKPASDKKSRKSTGAVESPERAGN